MLRKVITYIRYPVLIAGLVLGLVGVAYAAANIDSDNKWAWGANVGWINFNPTHGGGVTVYSDHLEGYVWGENIGWIRLGTTGSGDPYYDNDAANTYGVNNDGNGNLSGYAWGANVGWINFDPSHHQVTIDPDTGKFDGYAWGENVGWIHFQNASPEYYVQTDWTPTVVTLARFVARSAGRDLTGFGNLSGLGALVVLGAVGGMLLLRRGLR
jgi:hypothetical protein